MIELLDFASTLLLAHSGKVDDARRNFAARSQWMAPSFGAVSAAVTMLRSGAKPEQLFGALAVTADAMWQKRRDLILAQMLEMDTNNRKLFSYILPYARIRGFEALSKSVWRTDKPRFLFKEPLKNSKFTLMTVDGEPLTQPDALTLNAALLAKARGFKGFVLLRRTEKPEVALVQFGNVDDPARLTGARVRNVATSSLSRTAAAARLRVAAEDSSTIAAFCCVMRSISSIAVLIWLRLSA